MIWTPAGIDLEARALSERAVQNVHAFFRRFDMAPNVYAQGEKVWIHMPNHVTCLDVAAAQKLAESIKVAAEKASAHAAYRKVLMLFDGPPRFLALHWLVKTLPEVSPIDIVQWLQVLVEQGDLRQVYRLVDWQGVLLQEVSEPDQFTIKPRAGADILSGYYKVGR